MRVWNTKWTWERLFFVCFLKHHCPACATELEKVRMSRVVHSASEEAKEFDFSSSGGDGYMIGNVRFVWTELRCPRCDRNYSVKEISEFEKKAGKKQ